MLRLLKAILILSIFTFWSEYSVAQETEDRTESGWTKIVINIPEFYLVVDDNINEAIYMQNGDSLKLEKGSHNLRFISKVSSDYQTKVWIQTNKMTVKRIQLTVVKRPPRSSYNLIESEINYRITTDTNSIIFINDKEIGKGNAELFLNPGVYKLKTVHPEYGSLTKRIKADYYEAKSIHRYNENPNSFNPMMRMIPGYSYMKNKQYGKAVITYSGIAVLTAAVLFLNRDYERKSDLYDVQYDQYLNASSFEEATLMAHNSKHTISQMKRIDKQLTTSIIGLALIYVGSTIDGFIKPRSGYKWSNKSRVNAGLNLKSGHGNPSLHLSLKAHF